jgi:putative adenylate-forming enzyme
MQDLLTDLESLRPDILAAPPSLLYDISLARRNGRITIEPSQVVSFAEVLHDSDRRFIEETFSVVIREVYQCTEGFLGVSCSCGTIHLNEDLVLFEKEWIDERHFYPVITDFSRRIQPVVKYRMDDILEVKKEPCECGSPMLAIERITGRDDDVLVFGSSRIYPDLVARRIAQATGDFNSYKIVQVAENRLEVRIDCDPSYLNRVQEAIRSALKALFSEQLAGNVDFVFKEWIENLPGDKMRKIQRQINEK